MISTDNNLISIYCDKIRFVAFCIMVFFLPIASSFIEGAFGIIILTYIVQRTAFYRQFFVVNIGASKSIDWKKLWDGFLISYKPVPTPLNKPIGMYMLIAFVSIFVSSYPGSSLKAFIFQLAQATFTYFLFVETVKTKKRLSVIVGLLLASATLLSLNGIFQYFARVEYIRHHPINDGRVTSTFGHANNLAGYLIAVLPVFFSLSAINGWINKAPSQLNHSLGKLASKPVSYIFLLVFLLAMMCLGLTYSRGPIIIFCLSMLFFVWRKPKYLLGVFLVVSLFATIFFAKMYEERTTNIHDKAEGVIGLAKRMIYWEEAVLMIKDYPVLGVGLNNYSMTGVLYKINWGGYPHNGYLHIAAEIGILGLMAFIWIWVCFINFVNVKIRLIDEPFLKKMLMGIVVGLAAFFAWAFFDTNFHDDRLETLMWLLVAISVSLINIFVSSPKSEISSVG